MNSCKIGDHVKVDPSRGRYVSVGRVISTKMTSSQEATIIFPTGGTVTFYCAHLYQDAECHQKTREWRNSRSSNIGKGMMNGRRIG